MARVVATEASSQTSAKVHIVQARCLLAGQRREQVRARAFAAARLERCPLAVVGVEQPRDVRVKSLVYMAVVIDFCTFGRGFAKQASHSNL